MKGYVGAVNRAQAQMRHIDTQGVPYYEAPGEGEAACAALNACGWAHGCHTLDVDALLFGAQTVYRQLQLHVSPPGAGGCRRRGGGGHQWLAVCDGRKAAWERVQHAGTAGGGRGRRRRRGRGKG